MRSPALHTRCLLPRELAPRPVLTPVLVLVLAPAAGLGRHRMRRRVVAWAQHPTSTFLHATVCLSRGRCMTITSLGGYALNATHRRDPHPPPAASHASLTLARPAPTLSHACLSRNQVLGRGNFGAVHLGVDKQTGEQVAIKVIRKPTTGSHREEQVILNEIAILKEVCARVASPSGTVGGGGLASGGTMTRRLCPLLIPRALSGGTVAADCGGAGLPVPHSHPKRVPGL